MQVSRRVFLTGRRASDPWKGLLDRLRIAAPGAVWVSEVDPIPRVYVRPGALDAVPEIGALARSQSFSLSLAVAAPDNHRAFGAQGGVALDFGALTACSPVPGLAGAWLAEPGCLAGELANLGLGQFDSVPPEWTLARWAAGPATPWRSGGCADSGVLAVDVLFDDGTMETLGAFGKTNTRPLRSARLQRLVPALFELRNQTDGMAAERGGRYEGFRLDALQPDGDGGINLAHLMLGHAGCLALPLRWLLAAGSSVDNARAPLDTQPDDTPGGRGMTHRDAAVRHAFDPLGCFGGLAPLRTTGSTASGSKE